MWIGDQWFAVVGILDPVPLLGSLDSSVFIGGEAAARLLDWDGKVSTIFVRTPPKSVNAVRDVLAATVNPLAPNEVEVSRPTDALEARTAVDRELTALLLGLGGVALLVGGIGIANVMVISVLERRSEIGVRRAIGATRRHIRVQFLTEAAILASIGGVGGALLGSAVTAGYARAQDVPFSMPPAAIAGGVGAALVVGAARRPAPRRPRRPPRARRSPPPVTQPPEPSASGEPWLHLKQTGWDFQRARATWRATRFSSRSWPPDTRVGSPRSKARSCSVGERGRCRRGSTARARRPSRRSGRRGRRRARRSRIDAGDEQRPRHRVHPADVGVEQVGPVDRLAPQLGVEVEPAGREPAAAQDLEHAERHLLDRHREAVDVPAEAVVAGVGVDRPEDAGVDGGGDLVGEVVARQRGVVDLDVDLDLVGEVVALQEGVHGGDVVVVLVLGRLERLGLDAGSRRRSRCGACARRPSTRNRPSWSSSRRRSVLSSVS